jgi:hypothetical protein
MYVSLSCVSVFVGSVTDSTRHASHLTASDVADALFLILVKHFAGIAAGGDCSEGGQPGHSAFLNHEGRGGRGRRSGRVEGLSSESAEAQYCFVHGYGHAGKVKQIIFGCFAVKFIKKLQ